MFLSASSSAAALSILLSASLAQVSAVRGASPDEGVPVPFDAPALSSAPMPHGSNPASILGPGGASLSYLHDRNTEFDRTADALSLSLGLGPAAIGLSESWVRWGGDWEDGAGGTLWPDHRTTRLSLAFGSEIWGIGASFRWVNSGESKALDGMALWDVGAYLRPVRFLSIGAGAFALNAPDFEGGRLPRCFDVGLGFRPGTDRVEIGLGWRFDDLSSLRRSLLTAALKAEVVPGLLITAGISSTPEGRDIAGQVGIALQAEHFAAGYAMGMGISKDSATPMSHTAWATLSTRRTNSLPKTIIPSKSYALLDVESFLSPGAGSGLLSLFAGEKDGWLALLGALKRIEEDSKTSGVVVKLEGSGELGLARAEELSAAIQRLRQRGKKAVALLMGANDADYLAALACDKIVAVRASDLFINGFAFSNLFAGPLLDRLGVKVDVVRTGRFKTAPEQFTESGMSGADKEQLGACLDTIYPRFVRAVSEARHIPEDRVRSLMDEGILTAQAARQAGLIDEVLEPDALGGLLGSLESREVGLSGIPEGKADLPARWGSRPKIALVRLDGLITGGESAGGLLERRSTGAADVIRALQSAWADGSVRAVVLAINSGGGSSTASDLIWRSVRLLAQEKPVVVSLGDVAASGGYYIASAGTEILTLPSTLTGSIGVFIAKPSFDGLMSHVGVSSDAVRRGASPDLMSLARPWNDREKAAVQTAVESAYDLFLSRVAEGRRMEKSAVASLAEGRVWVGSETVQRGLADGLGGLSDAISRARLLAGLSEDDEADVIPLSDKSIGARAAEALSLEVKTPDWGGLSALLGSEDAFFADFLWRESGQPLALFPWKSELR